VEAVSGMLGVPRPATGEHKLPHQGKPSPVQQMVDASIMQPTTNSPRQRCTPRPESPASASVSITHGMAGMAGYRSQPTARCMHEWMQVGVWALCAVGKGKQARLARRYVQFVTISIRETHSVGPRSTQSHPSANRTKKRATGHDQKQTLRCSPKHQRPHGI
jgi:hypothetical protein